MNKLKILLYILFGVSLLFTIAPNIFIRGYLTLFIFLIIEIIFLSGYYTFITFKYKKSMLTLYIGMLSYAVIYNADYKNRIDFLFCRLIPSCFIAFIVYLIYLLWAVFSGAITLMNYPANLSNCVTGSCFILPGILIILMKPKIKKYFCDNFHENYLLSIDDPLHGKFANLILLLSIILINIGLLLCWNCVCSWFLKLGA